ncbi:GntR family transcriptional regulator [Sporosarcina sp. Marseille-Q4063]|uniref:GntR family transcriptional regulator n=1 Tax=Sporosarcina sp. Marseille-Q4063 TaxID=2810514 RepID=UPI001BAF6208|nr:GntR family transcriptional regulator [Sporosarcina sp. Marseille-Q4063]QUW21356.1 GntR family transcriptional regulator [Sporosarcina sp. Marseille-Q4063]
MINKNSLRSDSLVEVAYHQIKQDFSVRVVNPGEKIIIKDMVDRYGISETPIKQALNRLIAEGLVENIPRRGMRFKEANWEDIEEMLDTRLMLETFFAHRVIESVSLDNKIIDDMRENIKQHYKAIEKIETLDDFFEVYKIDHDFHLTYMKGMWNKKILQIYESIGSHSFSSFLYGKKPKEKLINGVLEHEDICNALENRDLKALEAAIKVHNDNAKEYISLMIKMKNI